MDYATDEELKVVFNRNIQLNSLQEKSSKEALKICGELIDSSYYLNNENGLKKAIKFLEELKARKLSEEEEGILYYYWGNAYSDLENLKQSQASSEIFENPNKEKSVYYYRKALSKNLSKEVKSQVLINLGNLYDYFGRFVRSLDIYDSVLQNTGENTNYENHMAYGNNGIALFYYGSNLHDKRHRAYFWYFAYKNFEKALTFESTKSDATASFKEYFDKLKEKGIDKIKIEELKLNEFSLGDSDEEIKYRQWCLKNKLFLNPINDLGDYTIVAHDVLHLPSMILSMNQNHIEFPSFFNQLKQEYVSARYLFYDGMQNIGKNHFSDKEVLLINPLDYPRYSLNVEKIKISFKMAYSLFDKISLFLRRYLKLNFKRDYTIDFRNLWYGGGEFGTRKLNTNISSLNNWAFRGLFLISKELLFHHPERREDEKTIEELQQSLEPSAKEINLLRNHLEHGYLKVHENFYNIGGANLFKDGLSYSISEADLKNYTLKLLKLSREALINLAIGIKIEEQKKESQSKGKVLGKMISDIYEDNWKF